MQSVNCGVNDNNGKLTFDRSTKELATCKSKDFSFEIQSSCEKVKGEHKTWASSEDKRRARSLRLRLWTKACVRKWTTRRKQHQHQHHRDGKVSKQRPISIPTISEIAVFQIRQGGKILREHRSHPFSPGAISKKNMSVNKQACVVRLKKNHMDVDLHNYF